jgi:hypothetical protein
MTTAVNRKTDTQLLYLAVDLGENPPFERFVQQVNCLEVLQRYCRTLVEPEDAQIAGQASPYTQRDVTELLEALDALHITDTQRHLLNEMVQTEVPGSPLHRATVTDATAISVIRTSMSSPWVTVMAELVRNSQPIAYALAALLGLHKLLHMIMEWQKHRQELVERRSASSRSQLLSLLVQHEQNVGTGTAISDEARHEAAAAIAALDTVLAADMVEPDDPRARLGH